MKTSPTIFFFFLTFASLTVGTVQAQAPIAVEANDNITVTLFFPSKVVKVVPPALNFKFDYERDTGIGTLRGRKGNPSNLTVITENGYIYSFALSYAEQVEEFNYMLDTEQAIGRTKKGNVEENKNSAESVAISEEEPNKVDIENKGTMDPKEESEQKPSITNGRIDVSDTLVNNNEGPVAKAPVDQTPRTSAEDDLYDVDRQEYYRIFCENNYLQKTIFKRSFRQSKKISLKLNNILVDRNEIYFVLQIENNSKKEYKVNGLGFFRKSAVGQLQKIIPPLYKFNVQETIDPESINEIVYVFKNFKISSKEMVHVVLDELENNRTVLLPLDYKQVNAPTN